MAAVNDDMPDVPRPYPREPSGVERVPEAAVMSGRRRNELLSDEDLQERHRERPAVGRLAVEVRRYMLAADKAKPFASFARRIHEELPAMAGDRTVRQISTTISGQCTEPSGFSVSTVRAALRLLVPADERAAKAREWADLIVTSGRPRPDFTPLLRGLPATPEDTGAGETEIDDPRDQVIAQQRQEILELSETLRTSHRSVVRYAGLGSRWEASEAAIDAAAEALFAEMADPLFHECPDESADPADPAIHDLGEDFAVSAEDWRDRGVSPRHWTVITPIRVIYALFVVVMITAWVLIAFQLFVSL